jgi:uncharacterized protein with HEPN domain
MYIHTSNKESKKIRYCCLKPDIEIIKSYVQIIVESIDVIFYYLRGVDEESFLSNDQLQDACLMRLVIIGEYAAKIPVSIQQCYSEIEWKEIKVARNFYVHVYLSVGWQKVWNTIHDKLPTLRKKQWKLI